MRRRFARLLCLALFMTAASCTVSLAQPGMREQRPSSGGEISVSYFYDALEPDGEWFQDPSYGWCWTPYDLSADWRPYSDGHWEYTDYGWSWASNEPWGWATYHYGRWFFDDSYGWAWVPGSEWAPAWVAWRYGDDYVGWAPLPPTAGWDHSSGLSYADAGALPPNQWCFVPRQQMLSVSLRLQVTSVARNVTLIGRSRDATRFEVRNGRPANMGLDVTLIETTLRRPVPRVTIVDVDTPARGRGQQVGSGSVGYFRPAIRPSPSQQPEAPAFAARRNVIPDAELQRRRDTQQRKLESDLKSEHSRLARDQANELRSRPPGPGADEVRRQQAAEQQAFDAHAAQQRQVFGQRMQKQVVRPARPANDRKPQAQDNRGGQGNPDNHGNQGNQDKKGNRGKPGNGDGHGDGNPPNGK